VNVAAAARLAITLALGVAAALGCLQVGQRDVALVAGWIVTAGTFVAWTWLLISRLDPDQTCAHATREDPPPLWAHWAMLTATVASLGGVGYLLAGAGSGLQSGLPEALVGVASIAVSWTLVHTLFALRYAHLYYTSGGGIDFNAAVQPDYLDFCYLSFTMGMTYQVSDTSLTTPVMRRVALRQALLSYVLGAVVIAMTINLVVQLASTTSTPGH
jgi:uncharacterized membrane protein